MSIRTVSGISIIGKSNDNYLFYNSKNNANLSKVNQGISYDDPFGNHMVSYPCYIQINFEPYRLEKMGDEFRRSDGTMIIMMPEEQIQEIANKTFYAEGQFHAIDFLTYTITEEK